MKLKAEWGAVRRRIEAALHPANRPDASDLARPAQDNREWVLVYRTASGFCFMYRGLPVDFEDMLDVQMWAEEMDVRTYFMGM
ncbi:hypothetical protein LMG28688_05864 [Paraburkholderia caffeinitolerans]|uniref:Uncharacterized protein n=1 Tax=Paraburkholderia caffeinitolerans TaxID=1723730 RepID=A0A6J5GQ40_9BURK|nr:hypothetical protein [Paraburkholderia caffeinitolerans]CAB3803892.1 hypothetical protein LMG28688_05864 [Paraburkholderia caffeinitolerans]